MNTKVIITCAVTGSIHTPTMSPYLPIGLFDPANLVVPATEKSRGNFLTFDHPEADSWQARLKENNIVVDVRGIRLRVGFGLYHHAGDVERLLQRLRKV